MEVPSEIPNFSPIDSDDRLLSFRPGRMRAREYPNGTSSHLPSFDLFHSDVR